VWADSAYYNRDVVGGRRPRGRGTVLDHDEDGPGRDHGDQPDPRHWTPIQYPNAIFDEQELRWISDAEVAEIGCTAFTSRRKAEHVSARLIVRRVRRLNPATAPAGQDELLAVYRHHAVFTDSPLGTLEAEASHRDHAIVE
jgi:hypothetical protein